MKWTRLEKYQDCFCTSKEFNGYTYNLIISVESSNKSVKYYVSSSSGKKRKEFDIFEEKFSKSLGGIRALFWLKQAVLDFPSFYANSPYGRGVVRNKNIYICIGWSDSRRKKIYQKYLEKEGFKLMKDNSYSILMKKL
jgi:hypothetical protein